MNEFRSQSHEPGYELARALVEAMPFAVALTTRTKLMAVNEAMSARFAGGAVTPSLLLQGNQGLDVILLSMSNGARCFLLLAPPVSTLSHRASGLAVEWQLTRREREVLELLADGASTRDIAAQLDVGPRTVESHVARLLLKSGSESRTELVARLWQRPTT